MCRLGLESINVYAWLVLSFMGIICSYVYVPVYVHVHRCTQNHFIMPRWAEPGGIQ